MPPTVDHLQFQCASSGPIAEGSTECVGKAWQIVRFSTKRALAVMAVVLLVGDQVDVRAEELLLPDSSTEQAIDHFIQKQLDEKSIPVVGRADDMLLMRRMTLDLAGRIPTAVERSWFRSLPESDRRLHLVDRLMDLPDFDTHHRNWLDETLLPDKRDDGEFRAYLLAAVKSRRSWDTIFREIMKASPVDGPENGASRFLRSRLGDVDDLTNDTAILFFGVNISCAKCHDHPLVSDWKQDHFYGMQSFFRRTYSTRKKGILAERPFGDVKFATVGGEEKSAAFMFLTGETVNDRTPQFAEEERKQLEERVRKLENEDIEAEILIPEFRPREELVEVALRDDTDRFFARNIVNRIWARLLGTGLVNPPDQLHKENPASHPQLFEWLTNDLVEHGYDLRRLIRGIVLSEAYARSSEWTSGSEPPPDNAFAVAQTRPLTPRQLAASLQVAVRNPERWPAIDQADEWLKRHEEIENQANGWVREFEQPAENFRIAVDEALLFSNNERVQNDLLQVSDDRLLGQLSTMEDQHNVIELLWMTVLNRDPLPDEVMSADAWLERAADRKGDSRRQLLWALIAGPEFRFNH